MAKSFTFGAKALTGSGRKRTVSTGDQLRASARIESSAGSPVAQGANVNTISRAWQQLAWQFYESIGEAHYSSGFIGACLARCTLTIGVPDSEGHVGPAFDEEGEPLDGLDGADDALALVRRLKSRVGGQAQLLRNMGINFTVAGEMHLVGDAPNGLETLVAAIDEWEVLSTDEFRRSGKDYVRHAFPGAQPVQTPAETVHAIRIWRNHPRFSELPDSSFRAVLDILEELEVLTREVRGEALSRLARAGILLVPQEIEYPDDQADDGDGDAGDPFTRDLINTMSTAIRDKGSAAQTVPFVVRAPAEFLSQDVFRLIDMSPKNIGDSAAKRTEAVRRFAQGVDLPVEIVTGSANCVDTDTEILTADGWCRHSELVIGDEVLTLNHETGLSEWQSVQDISRFTVVDHPMISLEGLRHSSLTTLDHKWPVITQRGKRRWYHSADLNTNSRIIPMAPVAHLPTEAKWSDEFVELVAWFWTEGYFNQTGGGYFCQSERVHPDHCANIRRMLSHLIGAPSEQLHTASRASGRATCSFSECSWPVHGQGLCNAHRYQKRIGIPLRPVRRYSEHPGFEDKTERAWRESYREDVGAVNFHLSKLVVDELHSVMNEEKVVSNQFIRELTRSQLELFIQRSIDGDGWSSHSGAEASQLHQKIPARSEAFAFACLLAGRSVSYRENRGGYADLSHQVNTRTPRLMGVHHGIRKEKASYTGTVWCPTVPNGTWLARRKGHVHFTGNTTFSNAVQIDDSLFKSHIEPLLEIICDALTAGYLRPALGDDTPFVVYYDSTELVARPNRAQDAKDLHDRFVISDATLRGSTGFSDSDAPDDDELEKRIRIKQLTLVRQTIPSTPQGLEGEDVGIGTDSGMPTIIPSSPPPGAPIQQGPGTTPGGNNTDKTLAASLQAAAEVSVERAVARAGARLRSKAEKDKTIRSTLAQVPDAEVAKTLGPSLVERFTNGDDLFASEFDTLRNWTLRQTGNSEYAEAMKNACLAAASKRLYEPREPFWFDQIGLPRQLEGSNG